MYKIIVYISSEQALLLGIVSLLPLFNSSITFDGFIPGYGILAPLNTSQHSTPYDH